MEVPRLGIESELQLPPIAQLQQCWIFDPLCRTGDQTRASAVTQATAVRFLTHCATEGAPCFTLFHSKSSKSNVYFILKQYISLQIHQVLCVIAMCSYCTGQSKSRLSSVWYLL